MFTILAIIFALTFPFFSQELNVQAAPLATAITNIGILFLFLTCLSLCLSYIPLQSTVKDITPSLFELYRKDRTLLIAPILVCLFVFFSILLVLNIDLFNFLRPLPTITAWLVGLGVAFDALILLWRRTSHYLNPFKVVDMFSGQAKKSIQDNREIDLCDSIDALSEIATRAVTRTNMALAIDAISELKHTAKVFLESSKTIGHEEENPQLKQLGVRDKVSFILFYILQRCEMIFDYALERKLEPICSFIITSLGKVTVFAANYDITMTSYPLHFINKLALRAVSHGLHEVGVKTTLAILEIAKTITTEMPVAYMELQPPFLTMINTLDAIAKETFKNDKKTNIRVLIQPFLHLKELFKTEKMANHTDTPVIVMNIDRAISEYETLEAVLKTMPPMPNIVPEDSK